MKLTITKRTEPRLLKLMAKHYSHPKGFVGRNICYSVTYDSLYYGHIVAGSATRFLPNRFHFFNREIPLNNLVNNIFFHIEPRPSNGYPTRNFAQKVLKAWRARILIDWELKYDDKVMGFESLVELPRTGECYRRDGWFLTGRTIGYTCKRVAGKGTDSWTGARVWDTTNLRPKLVFMREI